MSQPLTPKQIQRRLVVAGALFTLAVLLIVSTVEKDTDIVFVGVPMGGYDPRGSIDDAAAGHDFAIEVSDDAAAALTAAEAAPVEEPAAPAES